MNRELLSVGGLSVGQFGQNYPSEFDGLLDCVSLAVTCAFNRRGTLLAVGCNDGRIAIWDLLTRGIAKTMTAHVHPVSSLSFSRSGRTLASSSTDNTVCVSDVLTSEVIARWRFPTPVQKVQFNPRNESLLLVVPWKHAALLLHLPVKQAGASGDGDGDGKGNGGQRPLQLPLEDSDVNLTASYDRRGEFVLTGNAKGRVCVINVGSGSIDGPEIVASFRVTGSAIKQIEFADRQDVFLVNTADRVIRVYEAGEVLACGVSGEPEAVQKLQDLVNKTTWKKCCFAPDAEYVCAGSSRSHAIYVWERGSGTLLKILHGTKGETLLDVVWHPTRAIICSVSSGLVSVWAQPQVENWSAFAPDFQEMDENVEYEERESEFDQEDEDRSPDHPTCLSSHPDKESRVGVDLESRVDVVSLAPPATSLDSSDDEDDAALHLDYLPVTLEIEDPDPDAAPVTVHPDSLPPPVLPPSSLLPHSPPTVIDVHLSLEPSTSRPPVLKKPDSRHSKHPPTTATPAKRPTPTDPHSLSSASPASAPKRKK